VTLYAFDQGDGVVGYGGLETYGDNTLVRSILVKPTLRSQGVGCWIVEQLRMRASSSGARCAFVLTKDAQAYFERPVFAVVDRKDAAPTILATPQAAGLCPASAVLMIMALMR